MLGSVNYRCIFLTIGALIGSAALSSRAKAALILQGSVNANPPAENLTSDGGVDWAVWDYQSNTAASDTGMASNVKNGGAGIISAVSAVSAGGTPRGITGTGTDTFTYTDGTSTVNHPAAAIGAETDSTISTNGAGIKFTITGNPGQMETARIFVTGFAGTGNFSASLPGATSYTDSSQTYSAGHPTTLYTVQFEPALAGDLLTVTYITSNAATNANMDLQAVAVSVPEPLSAGLMTLGAVGLLFRRRRNSEGHERAGFPVKQR